MAFQILDDVLDVSGPPERTGKPRGADLLDGTVTLPLILARESDPCAERRRQVTPRRRRRCATGSRRRAPWTTAREQALAPRGARPSARWTASTCPTSGANALRLVADGVVERYA